MKGKIIVIEGTNCSGKETQSKLLEERLNKAKKKCKRFAFPMYDTPTGKIVGGAYLGKEEISPSFFKEGPVNVDPYVSSLYYAADRKYNMKMIEEYIDNGYYVILDRYTSSNQAHQGSKIIDDDERFNMYQLIDKLEYWLLKLPKPDITIYLHVPYENVQNLLKVKKDEHEKSEDHLKNAEKAYIELSEIYNWTRIECTRYGELRSIEDISNEILERINEFEEKENNI